jgi:ABC-type transport system involved in multi-copper enzyme maturation permease subunit
MSAVTPTTEAPGARPIIPHVGVPGLRLVRSEFRKIATTNAWWLFGLASLVITGLAMWGNMAEAAGDIARARDTSDTFQPLPGMSPADVAEAQARFAERHDLHMQSISAAGSIFTSGQFFGLVLVMLLGILVITNEFQYQTATATFLTTPHRSRVVVGKLAAAVGLGFVFWLVSQAISLVGGLLFFQNIDLTNSLGEWPVQRAILLNLLAYLLWAIFGFGLGTLIRSQIGSVVTGMTVYLLGYLGGIGIFVLIRTYLIHGDWVLTAAVIMPSIASQIMISPEPLYPQSAVWWLGALVMLGWSALAGAVGVLLTRRRDIS